MVAQQSIGEVITGTVEAVNVRGAGGVKVNGAWYNVSKWADNADFPDKGETVTLHLDKSNFIRSIERQGGAAEVAEVAEAAAPRFLAGPDRSRSIERQVALKAATELAVARIAAGGSCSSAEVLTVAQSFATWLAG